MVQTREERVEALLNEAEITKKIAENLKPLVALYHKRNKSKFNRSDFFKWKFIFDLQKSYEESAIALFRDAELIQDKEIN